MEQGDSASQIAASINRHLSMIPLCADHRSSPRGDTPSPPVPDRSVMRVPNPASDKPTFFESQLVEEKHAYTCGFAGAGQGPLEENHR